MPPDLRERLQSTLGNAYALERELGSGGMSRVFVAEDRRLQRRIVIKVLSAALAEGVSAERFERELVLAAGLQHPHVVPVLGAGAVDGLSYYTMPYVEGENLRTALAAGTLAVHDVLAVLRDVAEALAYAHGRGVVHRDVKPENVLLSGRAALVTDFGIAKALTVAAHDTGTGGTRPGGATGALTQLGTVLGTPAYMAPEQAAGDPATDHRADLYAWGMMAYEAFNGHHPFAHRTTPQALLAAQFVEIPAPLGERRPDLPPGVVGVVMRCLEKEPGRRPADADALIATLAAAHTGAASRLSGPAFTADRSLVVLPFANLSADPENEYFSDGLTDEIIADLSRVRALQVISRSSAMAFKSSTKGVPRIAEELGVRYVLEGSVRKAGANLRITARLVDATTDTPCWADKYAGTMDDVFDLQERVSRAIVRALDVTLSAAEDRSLAARPIADVAAFDCYLRARHDLQQASPASLERAEALLHRGLALAGGENARLRATLASVDVLRIRAVGRTDAAVLDAAAAVAGDILRGDPGAGPAHFVLGAVAFERGQLQEAATHYRRALHADPHDVDAAVWLGIAYVYAGQVEAARALFAGLRRQDPLNPFPHALASAVEWFDGRFADGVEPMARCMELAPEGVIWRWHWGYLLALVGRVEEAAGEAERMWRAEPANPYARQLVALAAALGGDRALAREALDGLDAAAFDPHLTFHVAECHVLAGDHARGIALVERAVARGFYPYAFIARHDPFLAAVRDEPRFAEVAREAERRWRAFVV